MDLQRLIWGESDLETEPYTTFVVAHQTGGQVLGAFDEQEMVGFTLAIVGLRERTPYLHSHMTGVLPSHRDRKVGRLLKLFQRDDALSRNFRRVEWTFDPLEIRNAHFNLNRLGAIVRTYIPNFYGITSSPLHRGLPTDRLLAEWHLDTPRTIAAIENLPTAAQEPASIIRVPAGLDDLRQSDPLAAEKIQSSIREEFLRHFSRGYAATSIRMTASGAEYDLFPWSDF